MESKPTPTDQTPLAESLRERYFVLFILAVTAITYVATLRFDFVYDDFPQIQFNPFIRSWSYVPQYFVSSVWKQITPLSPGNYYRPLFLLLLRVNYFLFATGTRGWHLVALALHVAMTWLVYLVVKKISGRFTLAWLTALIFGLHPIHHEVIAWVSGTTESLFALLFLAAFLAYLRSSEGRPVVWMAVSCALYALALLSKETAIVFPALVFAYEWVAYESPEGTPGTDWAARFRKSISPVAFYLPIALIYLAIRNKILSGLGHSFAPVPLTKWLMTVPSILLIYVRHWFLPIRLSESYDVFYQPQFSIAHVLLPALVVIALGAAIWALRKRLDAKLVGFAAAWIVIPLLPALDTFVFRPDELVHDRYFYVPSIGAALLISLIIDRVAKSQRKLFGQPLYVVGAGISLGIVLAFLSAQAVSPWVDDYALFSRAYEVAPLNGTALNNLSAELISREEYDRAQTLLDAGYRNDPNDFHFTLNLGRLNYRRGDYQKADSYMRRTVELSPDLAEPYVYLGQIQLKQGHAAEAQNSLHRAVELNPYSAPFHTSYGIVLALNGDCTAADQQFEAALALNPGEGLTQLQMARCRASLSSGKPPATKPGQL